MPAEIHDLADLVTNTFRALLGIKTVRPCFYQQFATSKEKGKIPKCENTLLVLLKLLKAEKDGKDRYTIEMLPAKLKQ